MQPTGTLFSENKDDKPAGSLFSGAPAQTSLFGAPAAGGLFGAPASGGLFNQPATATPSVFGQQANIFAKKEDKDDEDDNEPVAAEDEVPAYAADTASVKFKEGVQVPLNPMTKLYKVSVRSS